MFAPGRLYKHEKMVTVAAEILKSFYVKEKRIWKIKVRWWNVRSTRSPACMNPYGTWDERIEVPQDKIHEWKRINFDHRNEKPKLRILTFEQGRIQENSIGE